MTGEEEWSERFEGELKESLRARKSLRNEFSLRKKHSPASTLILAQ